MTTRKRMKEFLDDTSKFKKIKIEGERDYNHLINQELRISNALRRLRNDKTISEYTYNKLNPTGTQPSVLYGLSKVHKANASFVVDSDLCG